MRVVAGSDHAGLPLKGPLVERLRGEGVEVVDLGTLDTTSVDYPDFAHRVANAVASDPDAIGLLICGTGVGMSMSANRHAGVRAVVCSEAYSAAMARAHNNANVLCLGARVVGLGLAQTILEAFIEGSFEGGRHARRVQKIELPSA